MERKRFLCNTSLTDGMLGLNERRAFANNFLAKNIDCLNGGQNSIPNTKTKKANNLKIRKLAL